VRGLHLCTQSTATRLQVGPRNVKEVTSETFVTFAAVAVALKQASCFMKGDQTLLIVRLIDLKQSTTLLRVRVGVRELTYRDD
jgi:hypothetical protein